MINFKNVLIFKHQNFKHSGRRKKPVFWCIHLGRLKKYMPKRCDLCRRSATKGASRSHSKIQTLQRQGINLQTKTVDGLKLKVCTSCMRTMAKHEAEAKK